MDISRLNAPYQITEIDPWLAPHAGDIELRMNRFKEKRWQLVGEAASLENFANGYLFFGFHILFCLNLGSSLDELLHQILFCRTYLISLNI